MRFSLNNNRFDSARTIVTGTKSYLELTKYAKDRYTLYEHENDTVRERGDFTYEELKALWILLTARK